MEQWFSDSIFCYFIFLHDYNSEDNIVLHVFNTFIYLLFYSFRLMTQNINDKLQMMYYCRLGQDDNMERNS